MLAFVPQSSSKDLAWEHFHNPRADPYRSYPPELHEISSLQGFLVAKQVIETLPLYVPTPTRRLRGLAAALGIAELHVKDESTRFGLRAFKGVGGAYAVYQLLRARAERLELSDCTVQDFIEQRHPQVSAGLTLSCATTGNHGRSLARAAQMFGCHCRIYVPEATTQGRVDALVALGAQVVRHQGNYDEAVLQAEADAKANGWFIISDTAYVGHVDTPRDVMHGYRVIVDEVVRQLSSASPPTHVFIQTGVGGIAAAFAAHFWEVWKTARPRLVVVESKEAPCMLRSAEADCLVDLTGPMDTRLSGLAAGRPSTLAWEVLRVACDDFVTIADGASLSAMRILASGTRGDPPVIAGEAGAAGLGALMVALSADARRRALALDDQSRVLLIVTEGATDPASYEAIVGHTPDEVLHGAAAASGAIRNDIDLT
jgi:diaminopropionate ammonia-lyase